MISHETIHKFIQIIVQEWPHMEMIERELFLETLFNILKERKLLRTTEALERLANAHENKDKEQNTNVQKITIKKA